MNWRHLQAFVWLRWRLLRNQWRRAGALNSVLMMIVSVAAILTVIPLLIGSFMLGLYAIPKAAPAHLMYAWDGLIVAFLSFWTIGLVTELQRTEPLTLSKFLHLPVSVNGAFLINYLSSLVRLSLIFFGPIMLGYALALVWTEGSSMLLVLPSLAAFLVMVTALTYQLQGWLASLMSDPRRRRTVVVVTTMVFVLLVQLPNMINFIALRNVKQQANPDKALKAVPDKALKALLDEQTALIHAHASREIDDIEYTRRTNELMKKHESRLGAAESIERTARLVNTVLPIGWLPLGVATAAEGRAAPAVLGFLGMTLIGTVSLWRAYRTTVGMYQGQLTKRQNRRAPAAALPACARDAAKAATVLIEARVPGMSEPVSAIAVASLRSFMRSPEAKMMLLTPVIMIPIFGSMLWRGHNEIPEAMRPLIAIAGMMLVLFGLLQLMGNQFAFDRDGFRVFVLCSAARRDILLGKNLAFVPLALALGSIALLIVEVLCPLRLEHLMAMVPQAISMFLLFCIFTNLLSILTPIAVAAGSLKPASPNMKTVLLQMVMFVFLFPLTQVPTLLPLGTEAGLRFLGYGAGIPICLLLSVAELAIVVLVYYFSLTLLGDLLQARERKILEVVTKSAT